MEMKGLASLPEWRVARLSDPALLAFVFAGLTALDCSLVTPRSPSTQVSCFPFAGVLREYEPVIHNSKCRWSVVGR
jgi:hypothetical protein